MLRVVLVLCAAVCVQGFAFPDLKPRFLLFGEERIVGGHTIKITDAPYQVSVQTYNQHTCGASVISEYHVLTAAQCTVFVNNVENIMIGFGSANINDVQKYKVTKNTHHDSYNDGTIDYDVAVLKVATAFSFGATLQPIELATDEPADDELVVITGWGSLKSGGFLSDELNAVEIPVVNREVCTKEYEGLNKVTPRMICAGELSGGKDSCQGDSGGPMVSRKSNKQVGIISWGNGCARPKYPGVYTNIAEKSIQDFIQTQLKQ